MKGLEGRRRERRQARTLATRTIYEKTLEFATDHERREVRVPALVVIRRPAEFLAGSRVRASGNIHVIVTVTMGAK